VRGRSVFWDRRIPAGQTWRSYIGKALVISRSVVVVWSEASISSDWVIEEADHGKQRSVLVPVMKRPVAPPFGFRQIQAADLTGWTRGSHSDEFTAFLEDLDGVLGLAGPSAHGGLPAQPAVEAVAGEQDAMRDPPANRAPAGLAQDPPASPLQLHVGDTASTSGGGDAGPPPHRDAVEVAPPASPSPSPRGSSRARWARAAVLFPGFVLLLLGGAYFYQNGRELPSDLSLATAGSSPSSAPGKPADPFPAVLEGIGRPPSPDKRPKVVQYPGDGRPEILAALPPASEASPAPPQVGSDASSGEMSAAQHSSPRVAAVGASPTEPEATTGSTTLALRAGGEAPPLVAAPVRKVALVIGNSDYQHVPSVPNGRRDGESLAGALREIGFEVRTGFDVTRDELESLTINFLRYYNEADLAVVFFAGLGLNINGSDYIVPVDAVLSDSYDVRRLFPVSQLIEDASTVADQALVIIDVCRDNPFDADHISGRLADKTSLSPETAVIFSTSLGTVAFDGSGPNSPFAAALLRHLGEPNLELRDLFQEIKRDVQETTDMRQIPVLFSAASPLYLVTKPAEPSAEATMPEPDSTPPTR
jgi:hypothetical protein